VRAVGERVDSFFPLHAQWEFTVANIESVAPIG
jgi:hypothetical protein